jgi:hypothetical protein
VGRGGQKDAAYVPLLWVSFPLVCTSATILGSSGPLCVAFSSIGSMTLRYIYRCNVD